MVNETCDHPLALYIFSESENNFIDHILNRTTWWCRCDRDEHLRQLAVQGWGMGIGSYGVDGDSRFSHFRAVMYKDTR